jgi:hypothetical protein
MMPPPMPARPNPALLPILDRITLGLDPSILMERLGFTPDPWQREVLRSTDPRLMMLTTRQAGKSTTTAVLGLDTILHRPQSLALLTAPTQRQSKELFSRVSDFYSDLGKPVAAVTHTKTELVLENGSRIICLPGNDPDKIRCFPNVRLLVIDEAAASLNALFRAVSPMLAVSRGRLVALSTPLGQRGWYHDEWMKAHSRWRKVSVTADECPRIDPEHLADEKASMADWEYLQEYFCVFAQTENQAFSTASINAAFGGDVPPLFPLGYE